MGVEGRRTRSARAEEHGGIQLLVSSIKLQKQLEHLVAYLVKSSIGTVDLVYNDDDSVVHRKRLLQNEAGLGHGSLCRINEKDDSVNHLEYSLNLTTEVGVTGSVYYVDLNVLVVNGRVLCKYGNSALALQIVGVHYAVLHLLVFTINASLTEHLVYQRSLSVVNVSNNSYVS